MTLKLISEISGIICRYYLVITHCLFCFNCKVSKEKDIPAWSLAMMAHLWNRPCRTDGKTCNGYLLGNSESSLMKLIFCHKASVVLALYLWPIAAIFIIWKHKGQRVLQWKFALQRPDLYISFPSTPFPQESITQRHSDIFMGVFSCWDFFLHQSPDYKIDNKAVLEKIGSAAGLPVIKSLSLEEAQIKGGSYIVKIPDVDRAMGVQLVNSYEELFQFHDQKNILIQPLLKNDPSLQEILPPNAPLSTLRVFTTLSNSQPTCHHAFFRIGQSGSIVDNFCRGGIAIELDLKTGELIAYSPYESTIHPKFSLESLVKQAKGAQKNFDGVRLPFFFDAIELAERAHTLLAPSVVAIGWDLALVNNSWLIVEANIFAGSGEILRFNNSYAVANKEILKRINRDQ